MPRGGEDVGEENGIGFEGAIPSPTAETLEQEVMVPTFPNMGNLPTAK